LHLFLTFALTAVAGCCHSAGYGSACIGRPLPCDRCATPSTPLPGPVITNPSPPVAAAPVITNPSPPPAAGASPAIPKAESNFTPPASGDPPFSRFDPNNNNRLYPPVPDKPGPSDPPQAKLLPPQNLPNADESPPKNKATEEPPLLPADIPGFAIVKKGVAAGQRPFPEGVNWLKDRGYKTVLHVRPPTQTDTAAKRIFESRGLTYINLEVSSTQLTKEVVARFNEVVADEKNRPLFVYDEDSTLAGALWYLYFRTAEGLSDEKARAESSRLGFKQDQDDKSRDMWIAVQNYLRSQNP
jgi:protein tyrosine phosphatase (PTP) superfamily phosphohydrolase (DUF442 family)